MREGADTARGRALDELARQQFRFKRVTYVPRRLLVTRERIHDQPYLRIYVPAPSRAGGILLQPDEGPDSIAGHFEDFDAVELRAIDEWGRYRCWAYAVEPDDIDAWVAEQAA